MAPTYLWEFTHPIGPTNHGEVVVEALELLCARCEAFFAIFK